MYFKLFSLSLRRNHLFIKRCFRANLWQLKDSQDIRQSDKEVVKDKPIQYTTSKAGKWKAVYSSTGEMYHKYPRIQSTVVMLSWIAFMVYFGILREENDLDDWLRELETDIPLQLHELQLRAEIEQGKNKGLDVSFEVAKLNELTSLREKKKSSQ